MTKIHFSFSKNETAQGIVPNHWDVMAVLLILVLLFGLGYGASDMLGRFQIDHMSRISLSPHWLPYYALRSVIRMFMALFCSLVFTIIVGAWAAKSRRAERLIIPMIDVLQSVPVLGFLSITVVGFIALFPGRILGPECAAIFAIFTAQVWNMTLSFYQSVQTVPAEWGGGCADVAIIAVAAILAFGCAVFYACFGMEYDDVDVWELGVFGGIGGDLSGSPRDYVTWGWFLYCVGD